MEMTQGAVHSITHLGTDTIQMQWVDGDDGGYRGSHRELDGGVVFLAVFSKLVFIFIFCGFRFWVWWMVFNSTLFDF